LNTTRRPSTAEAARVESALRREGLVEAEETRRPLVMGKHLVPAGQIESRIYLIHGQKVMLDSDLAELYGVTTKALNRAVRRNPDRFPPDFMFQLGDKSATALRCQIGTSNGTGPTEGGPGHSRSPEGGATLLRSQPVTLNAGRGGRRYAPYVFTEHGAVMLASMLNSPIAIQASVQVVRAFVRIREILSAHKDLVRKIQEMEKNYDKQFAVVFDAIRQLMGPPEELPKGRIGFHGNPSTSPMQRGKRRSVCR
jgi:hypothetical protein